MPPTHARSATARRALVAGLAGLLAVGVAPAILPSAPAAAGTIPVTDQFDSVPPVTWVDADGRQYLVGGPSNGSAAHPSTTLTVARDRADGKPDTGFGSEGRRLLRATAPASGLTAEAVVAATDAGVLTLSWIPTTCDATTTACDRWTSRATGNGTTVGTPTHATTDHRPVEGLPDGSFLTVDRAGAIGWRGPDGTDRGAPPLDLDHLDDVTVDLAGRLIVASDTRAVTRWPAGGPATALGTVTGCSPGAPLVIGRSTTENGFATACHTGGDRSSAIQVQRRSATGAVRWTTAKLGTDPSGVLHGPTHALLDDVGRVWVGGRGSVVTDSPEDGVAMAQAWSSAGPGEIGYLAKIRAFTQYDTERRITDLRQAPGHRVAVADEEQCCIVSAGPGEIPGDQAHSAVAPSPVGTATTIAPFPSVSAFVRQQYLDLVGTVPAGEPAATAAQIAGGRLAPEAFAARLLRTGRGGSQVEPVARLYRAYFRRDADLSGLRHHVGRLRAGTRLVAISDEFAASSEFARTYGSLSLADFVRTLYRNVFGREGDAAGMDFWYRKLARRQITRGGMVLQFSESSEHVRARAPSTQAIAATFLLTDRLPTSAQTSAWQFRPEVRRTAARAVLAGSTYAARF